MSNCRDCIHGKVCENAFCWIDLNDSNKHTICHDFKPKSRFIELPCAVGDTVYMITPNGNIRNLTILSIDVEVEEEVKTTCLAVYEFESKPCYMQIHSSKFGKTVFLDKSEAEKALAERREHNA